MDFKCFINLLEEKGYIEKAREFKVDSEIEFGNIAVDYKCKYNEVKLKIMEEIDNWHACDLLHNIQYQTKNDVGKNEIKIIFIDKLKHHIWNKMCEEEFKRFRKSNVGFIWLSRIFENSTSYKAEWNGVHGLWEITDLHIKNMREEKERNEKEECLNFLKQLP